MTRSAAAVKDRQFVTALSRGLVILGCFDATRPELSGSQIAKITGLPQPTVWRLCHTMLSMGVLVSVAGDRLRPGLPALRLGYSVLANLSITEAARPHMQALADRFGAACGIGARDGLDVVFVQRCESDSQLLMNLRVGSRVPLGSSALGWAWLAGLRPAERDATIAAVARAQPERWAEVKRDFAKALAEYEGKGFITNVGVFHKGYNTAAVPILAADGSVAYALNCGSAASTLPPAKLRMEVAPALVNLAGLLQSALQAGAPLPPRIG